MSNLPANQHYVWRHYLSAWATPTKVWCMRRGQTEPFLTSPRNVASERFFYEFHELTDHDRAYLERLISQASDMGLRELNRGWVRDFQMTFAIRRHLEKQDIDLALRQQLESELRKTEKTIGEQLHSATESRAIPILDALRRGDSAFYEDTNDCITFIQFITQQFFRTANLRNKMLAIKIPLPHDPRRTWPVEAFIYATNVGQSLFAQRDRYRVVFLRNRSEISFITGDQPVINLTGIEREDLNLFYPLTPDLAMIYTSDREHYPNDELDLSLIAVENYNFQIYTSSDSQIYGNNSKYLKEMGHLPKGDLLA